MELVFQQLLGELFTQPVGEEQLHLRLVGTPTDTDLVPVPNDPGVGTVDLLRPRPAFQPGQQLELWPRPVTDDQRAWLLWLPLVRCPQLVVLGSSHCFLPLVASLWKCASAVCRGIDSGGTENRAGSHI